MKLPDNHFYLNAGQHMQELIAPLSAFKINYFTYNKHYDDGSRIRLTTNANHLKAFCEKKYYLNGNIDAEPELYMNQAVFCSTLPNQDLVGWSREEFDIHHTIYIIRKSKEYSEFFCFGASKKQTHLINFYLNNLDFLQSFCDSFKDQGKTLLKKAEESKLIQPYHHKSIELIDSPLAIDKTSALSKKLTKREIDLFICLIQGKTNKEIALQLNLSPRTVDFYFQRMRAKFNAKNKNHLLSLLSYT